jgi:ATP-dependent DNA ligase
LILANYLNLKPVEFDALGKRNQDAFVWEGRILMPKYDGCFAMVAFWNGVPNSIMSRTGEYVKSMDHIYADLLAAYPWIASNKGGTMVLGEAWNPGKEFSELSGIFRRQYPQPALGFAPFDIVNFRMENFALPALYSSAPYAERLSGLEVQAVGSTMIFRPTPHRCVNKVEAWAYARKLKELGGYDGAICSDPDATYTPGAGKAGEFIKLKPLVSYSLEVVAVILSRGAMTGRAIGTPVVRFRNGRCGVGTGFSNDAAEGWASDPTTIVGKIIEVGAMGVSSKGLLREPRFIGIREDVINPDY